MTNKNKLDELEPTETPRRRAGQRPDELLPGQVDPETSDPERHAAGTPGGGDEYGGLGGTNQGDGAPDELETEHRQKSEKEIQIRQRF